MCEAVSAFMAAYGGYIAAAAAAVGAYTTAQSQKAQNEYMEDVERNNAAMAKNQREDAIMRGGEEANRVQREAERMRGTQVVHLASNGLDISSGTPLAILEDSMFFGQQDANTVRNNAAREAWGYDVQGQNARASAGMYSMAAKANNPGRAAGLSLLSSAGQFSRGGITATSGGGTNMQGQGKALTNNTAFVKRM